MCETFENCKALWDLKNVSFNKNQVKIKNRTKPLSSTLGICLFCKCTFQFNA